MKSEEWENIPIDIETVDWKGNPTTVHNVPAERNTQTGKVRVDPEEVVKAEFNEVASKHNIEGRDTLFLILLYAKPGPFQRGYLCQKYKLNKMLFYQWKELEKEGLGDAIPHDEFEADRRGPVPKNLWEDMERLKKLGLIKVEGGRKVKKTVTCELTEKGEKIARKLWQRIPDLYLSVTTIVKSWLFPLSPETIKERVHKDYPEFRKIYTWLDKEEILKF